MIIKLLYTDAAQGDLVNLFEWSVGRIGQAATETDVQGLIDRCEDLARFPDMGRRRQDLDTMGLQARSITQNGRTILYTRRGDTLYIVRVMKDA